MAVTESDERDNQSPIKIKIIKPRLLLTLPVQKLLKYLVPLSWLDSKNDLEVSVLSWSFHRFLSSFIGIENWVSKPSRIALLAPESASSLPVMPLCAGTHISLTDFPLSSRHLMNFLISRIILLLLPGINFALIAERTDFESEKITNFLPHRPQSCEGTLKWRTLLSKSLKVACDSYKGIVLQFLCR